MIRVNVNLVSATITENETLTSGRVGLQCAFTFSSEWDGLSKIAVFEGAESADVAILVDDTVTVPAECFSSPGTKLRIGVYGMNGDGDIVIPTVFANAGRIQQGAEPSGVSPADPTPSWAAQVQAAAASALAKAIAVENEAANGDFDGADGEDGDDGVSPTINVTAITGGHKVTVTDAGGTTAFDVMDGQNGQDGQDGAAATVSVGTTTTLSPGSDATVTNSGTSSAAVLNFGIPKGDKGDTGDAGVYYGTTEPTDPNVTVWIDPSGTTENYIPAPSSPTTGQFLKWSGSAWIAASLPVYNGGVS